LPSPLMTLQASCTVGEGAGSALNYLAVVQLVQIILVTIYLQLGAN
jgi:hypothetical protein